MADELHGIDAFTEVLDRLETAHRKIFGLEEQVSRCRNDLSAAQSERDRLRQEISGLRYDITTKDAQIVALRASQNNNHHPAPAPAAAEPEEPAPEAPPAAKPNDDDTPF